MTSEAEKEAKKIVEDSAVAIKAIKVECHQLRAEKAEFEKELKEAHKEIKALKEAHDGTNPEG